jgi:hypothetical protein
MKNAKAIALAMAACVVLPSGASAKFKSRTISVDGYCDVFTVWEFGKKWVTLTEDPSSCEAANGVGQMTKNKYFGTAASAGITLNGDGSTALFAEASYPFATGGTVNLYVSNDGIYTQVLSSTYTVEKNRERAPKAGKPLSSLLHRAR